MGPALIDDNTQHLSTPEFRWSRLLHVLLVGATLWLAPWGC